MENKIIRYIQSNLGDMHDFQQSFPIHQHVTFIVLVWYPHNMDIWWLIFTWSSSSHHKMFDIICPQKHDLPTLAWAFFYCLMIEPLDHPMKHTPKLKAIWANCLYQVLTTALIVIDSSLKATKSVILMGETKIQVLVGTAQNWEVIAF